MCSGVSKKTAQPNKTSAHVDQGRGQGHEGYSVERQSRKASQSEGRQTENPASSITQNRRAPGRLNSWRRLSRRRPIVRSRRSTVPWLEQLQRADSLEQLSDADQHTSAIGRAPVFRIAATRVYLHQYRCRLARELRLKWSAPSQCVAVSGYSWLDLPHPFKRTESRNLLEAWRGSTGRALQLSDPRNDLSHQGYPCCSELRRGRLCGFRSLLSRPAKGDVSRLFYHQAFPSENLGSSMASFSPLLQIALRLAQR
jgi:hypothetical protein